MTILSIVQLRLHDYKSWGRSQVRPPWTQPAASGDTLAPAAPIFDLKNLSLNRSAATMPTCSSI